MNVFWMTSCHLTSVVPTNQALLPEPYSRDCRFYETVQRVKTFASNHHFYDYERVFIGIITDPLYTIKQSFQMSVEG